MPNEIMLSPSDVVAQLTEENENLRDKVEERAADLYWSMKETVAHKGKEFVDVGLRQQQRHLEQIRKKAVDALWFAETYGLMPQSLQLSDKDGSLHEVNVSLRNSADIGNPENQESPSSESVGHEKHAESCKEKKKGAYDKLSSAEKEKIRAILFIMDRFSISYEAYHELTQQEANLPRSYLVEGCQAALDSQWSISKTPGEHPGAELPLMDLLKNEIEEHLKESDQSEHEPPTVKVKISGDGARMSHSSSLFVCSFSLLDQGQQVLSSAGNHTIAVIKTSEDHDNLKIGLTNVRKTVNELISAGFIEINGRRVNLKFYLGGDYKFLLVAMGMKGAISNNSCIWCLIHKNDRCNMHVPHSFYESAEMKRKLGPDWFKQPGCQSQPLFDIPLNQIVIDELHLMLRVMDRLEQGLIPEVMDWDEADNKDKPPSQRKTIHLDALLHAVRSLGITLNVWKGKDTRKLEWTSLLGGEKRLLLRKLPGHFDKFLPADRVQTVRQLWTDFQEILDLINKDTHTEDEVNETQDKAKRWGSLLVQMAGTGPGYLAENIITPYIHIMIFHVPTMMRNNGSLKYFSGQGVEKKNDDFRRFFHRKINRWDACTSLLLVEKRQEALRGCQRKTREYNKRNAAFWFEGGKHEAAKKVPRISTTETEQHVIAEEHPQSKRKLNKSVNELKKLKVPELLQLLGELTGQQISLSKKPRKPDIILKISELATLRSE